MGDLNLNFLHADFKLSKIFFFIKIFREYSHRVKQCGSTSGPMFFLPDLGPNCLQRLATDYT